MSSGPYQIAEGPADLPIKYPYEVVRDAPNRTGTRNALMAKAASFITPGVMRSSWIPNNSGLNGVGTSNTAVVQVLFPSFNGDFDRIDGVNISIRLRNKSGAPAVISPAHSMIQSTNWTVGGSPLLQQTGQSMFFLQALTPQTLVTQMLEDAGHCTTQFLQQPKFAGMGAASGTVSFPLILSPSDKLTIPAGGTIDLTVQVQDCFMSSVLYSPPYISQQVQLQIAFQPGNYWCVQGDSIIEATELQINLTGRVFGDELKSFIRGLRQGRQIRIPTHLITTAIAPDAIVAGSQIDVGLPTFSGDYTCIFLSLRTRDINIVANGQMDWYWRTRGSTWNVGTGATTLPSAGQNYGIENINTAPGGSVFLFAQNQRSSILSISTQRACDNQAYLVSQFGDPPALNMLPFSLSSATDIFDFKHTGGAITVNSSSKVRFTCTTTIADAAAFIVGFKRAVIFQTEDGKLYLENS